MARMAIADTHFQGDHNWLLSISVVIKRERKLLKLTQEGLASKAGIHWRYLQEIEAGQHNNQPKNVSIGMVIALANGLEMSPTGFMQKIETYYHSQS